MKQTMTREGFIHALQGERSDKAKHNILILGHAVFDLHDAVRELLERTKDLYHPTVFPFSKGKVGVKIASEETVIVKVDDIPVPPHAIVIGEDKDDGVESF